MLTRVAPGRYKMVTKTKGGKTGDYEMNFTEHGVFETMTVGGLSASCFYRCLFKFSNNKEMIKTLIPCQFLLITVTPTTPTTGDLAISRELGRCAPRLALRATWTPAGYLIIII